MVKSIEEIARKSPLDEESLKKIEEIILRHGQFCPEVIRQEIDVFCTKLGMSDYYFQTTPLRTIASHIEALKAAEIMAAFGEEKELELDFATERKNQAIYLVNDEHFRALAVEKRIEEKYPFFRLQSYRTKKKVAGLEYLRMYIVNKPSFSLEKIKANETDIHKIGDKTFLTTSTPETLARYQRVLEKSHGLETPWIEVSPTKDSAELRIMVVLEREASRPFFTNVSDVFHSHNLVSNRKYIEQFANGKVVFVFYLPAIKDEALIQDLIDDISLIYVIPESPLSELFRTGKLTAQEMVFGVSAWSFAHQFLSSHNEEYLKLSDHLKDSPELLGILRDMKVRLAKDTYTEQRIWESFLTYPDFLKKTFLVFDKKFNPSLSQRNIGQELTALQGELKKTIPTEIDRDIFRAVLVFIEAIQRTNFFKKDKTSLAFMYRPNFLNPIDYPEKPYGIFHIIAPEMRGFHIRFRDIARGGIRIVRSANLENYLYNSDFIFDENYNLARTQQRKNKDIPEGGSKGTILLRWGFKNPAETAFKKYINGLLDIILPDSSVVDDYGQEVILFIGPDEGTAELMEWAALCARRRGYPYWKAFSTGKPVTMGGIPHDLYGMTTNSVHQYVLNILAKEGRREEEITKVMTGGPDGDLGSNEILISKDRIIAIIDGSGVLYDPQGINRQELTRLAKARKPVAFFRKKLLSPAGFLVTVEEENITLPGGEKIESGLEFRNTFHLDPRFQADLFVPCGGRPASININNWKSFLQEDGQPRFKYIVEGANLFLTQEARLRLEEHGVIIYKDASANKGGVTSSSLEVLAALALSDEEYDKLMCVKNGQVPEFRQQYVGEIIRIIRENASLEFEVIWQENASRHIPRAILTDMISEKINQVTDAIYNSELWQNKELFRNVIKCYLPQVLLQHIELEELLQRVPPIYLRALFASSLASRYVYRYGLEANEIHFFEFLKEYQNFS
jgi:glutamate dehydrogenase